MGIFKNVATISVMIASAAALTTPAMATTAPLSGTYEGFVDAFKGIPVACDAKVVLDWTSNKGFLNLHTGTNCDALLFVEKKGGPDDHIYNISWDNANHEVVFHNVYVETVTLGDCATPELRFKAYHSPESLEVNQVIPAATGPLSCTVIGDAERTSASVTMP